MRNLLEYFRAFTQCKCVAVWGNRNDRNPVCVWCRRLWGEPTCFLGLWWRSGVHLCVSAEAVQVPFDGLQRIIPTLLSRLRAHTRPASAQDAVGSASWKTEATCRVGRTSPWAWRCWAASASVSAPQTAVASCLPPAFSAGAQGVFWRGGQSEVVSRVQRWRSVINRLTVWITESMLNLHNSSTWEMIKMLDFAQLDCAKLHSPF